MFYVGKRGSLAGVVHMSPGGGMTLCGLLTPPRDRFGRSWWRDEIMLFSIADVLEEIREGHWQWDEYRRPCENCLRCARQHPERLISHPERCPECGQPDNCGDCDHTPLTSEDWARLGT